MKLLRTEKFILEWFPLLYGLLVLPAVDPFATFFAPRIYALEIFIFLILVLRLIAYRDNLFNSLAKSLRRQKPYVVALFCFLLFLGITVILSADAATALFGQPNARVGAVFIFLTAVTFLIYSEGPYLNHKGLVTLSVIFSMLTITEFLGLRPLSTLTEHYKDLDTAFPAVTVGHRGQVAGLSLIFALLPFYWFRRDYTNWKFWFIYIISVVALGCTTNSSALAAFLLSTVLIFVLLWRESRFTVLTLILASSLALSVYRPLTYINNYLADSGLISRKSESKNLESTTTFSTRIILWEAGLKMFGDKPLFGWGPQTYSGNWYNFLSTERADELFRLELGLNPEQKMVRIGDSAAYISKDGKKTPIALNYIAPHNTLIDLLYSQGIVGIISFLSFVFLLGKEIFSNSRNTNSRNAALIAVLPIIAYMIYLLAWFITVPVTPLAAMILGISIRNVKFPHLSKIRGEVLHA